MAGNIFLTRRGYTDMHFLFSKWSSDLLKKIVIKLMVMTMTTLTSILIMIIILVRKNKDTDSKRTMKTTLK